MPKRALIEHRPWLLAAVIAAVAFYFLRDNPIGGVWLILLKGAGVGFLTIYALRRAPGTDGLLLALALALSAAADMALELYFEVGGALFAASHAVVIALYLRNRREQTVMSQRALAIVILIAVPAISFYLSGRFEIAIYGAVLGALFRSAEYQREQSELVIIVTPHLVTPTRGEALALPTDRVVPPTEKDLFLRGRVAGTPKTG